VRIYTFAVPPCFAALSRGQPFWVQIHLCSVTGVPGGSYFCSHEHRFATTAHEAVSACLRPWLAPSASSLLPGDRPTSLAQRLFVVSTKSILFYAICQVVIWHGTGSVKDCQKDDLTSRATARVARTIPIYPVFHVNMYCTGDPGGRPGYHSQTLWHGTFHQEYSYISLPIVCTF